MKVYPSQSIRNIGIVSHQGAGKTSLTESLLFNTGATSRLGKVDEGNTVADYHPEEIKRKITVNTSLVACEWRNTKINLLDTPGFSDFFGEVKGTLRVSDCILMVLDAVAGVEVSTEIIWELADQMDLPRVAVINKMDRENADFLKALDSMREKLTKQIVPIQLPIGAEASFNGMVDLIEMKAYKYDGSGKASEIPIPGDLMSEVETYREMLIEAAAEGEDELTMKYLDGEQLTDGEIVAGLKAGITAAKVVPVLCASALKNIGADRLLNVLVDYVPSPLDRAEDKNAESKPMATLVFKTMADPYVGRINFFKVGQGTFKGDSYAFNATKEAEEKISQLFTMQGKTQMQLPEFKFGDIGVVAKLAQTNTGDTLTTKDSGVVLEGIDFPIPTLTVAIEPKSKGDEDKLGNAIHRLLEEDPTLRLEKNIETRQTLLTGMGEAHIDITIERLHRKFGVEVKTLEAKVPYRETIKGSATRVEGKHKKQSGGHGQYGHVYIDIAPFPEGDFEFTESIFGGSVPRQYVPAVEKGVRESMVEGILAGYPVTNLKVNLQDGSFHPVDSSEMAFKIAASLAFRKACEQSKPVLLEPIMNVEILVPDQFMGDIMGDLNSKRGRILGMEKSGNLQVIKANVPLSEMYRYAIDLKSITQGRGTFTMGFSRYEEVPASMAEKIIAAAKAEKEKEQ
ncbi:elongation factor G [Candidatus Formimonas warabiya]|uniref:Elongation factor G n=1 Tax=Formimonas warabiya TaxID=1761012 RepID=A0A3G1KPG8_FORW1|nr:elongation factor G [Candidatus Formimonas warabiya]ATW24338.1 translation elongation factor G [Candidatus Formimonas warabiya]